MDRFAVDRVAIESRLDEICSKLPGAFDQRLADAVQYGLKSPGKQLRPLLLQFAYRAAGGAGDSSLLACAPEVIHAYSLVHDDLPCMDDDDMRRGRPTVHRVYGVPIATAAGVAMVPLAALSALTAAQALSLDQRRCGEIVAELMRASGAGGMVGGQLLDLDGENRSLTLTDLEQIHRAKTGALIRSSVILGGLAAEATPQRIEALGQFGDAIGLAFQIADDVLDITGTTDRLGKPAG